MVRPCNTPTPAQPKRAVLTHKEWVVFTDEDMMHIREQTRAILGDRFSMVESWIRVCKHAGERVSLSRRQWERTLDFLTFLWTLSLIQAC